MNCDNLLEKRVKLNSCFTFPRENHSMCEEGRRIGFYVGVIERGSYDKGS